MRSYLGILLLGVLMSNGCDSAQVPPGVTAGPMASEDNTNLDSGWVQEKSSVRSAQERSTFADCYCFPKGPVCHDVFAARSFSAITGEATICVPGEVCDGDVVRYNERFDTPRGQCRRLCFHADARLPPGQLADEVESLAMDCSADEECRLTGVFHSFEGIPGGTLGMCFPAYRKPETTEPDPKEK